MVIKRGEVLSKRRNQGMYRREGDKRTGERAGDRKVEEKTGDDYYFDNEDDYSDETSLYKPAPPVAKEEKPQRIKVEKIRRDDKGRVLPDEPVPMPKENLYYNSDGYIPQENVNYSRKTEAGSPETAQETEGEALTDKVDEVREYASPDKSEAEAVALEEAEAEIQAEAQKELSAEVEKIVAKEASMQDAEASVSTDGEEALEASAEKAESEDEYFDEEDSPDTEAVSGMETLPEADTMSEYETYAGEEALPSGEGMLGYEAFDEEGILPGDDGMQGYETFDGEGYKPGTEALIGTEDISGEGALPRTG